MCGAAIADVLKVMGVAWFCEPRVNNLILNKALKLKRILYLC